MSGLAASSGAGRASAGASAGAGGDAGAGGVAGAGTDPGVAAVVYTDGSCLGNPGPGGWAWVVPDGSSASGAEPQTTNQRMEITAALEALGALCSPDGAGAIAGVPLLVMSDSTYVVNCFRQQWWQGWHRRGWRNTQGKPVANRDLWEPLLALALDGVRPVTFQWVKGHSGDRWNDVVDRMALEAAQRQRGTATP